MRRMKLQFSLATLLVCMTVLAVVAAISARMPVWELLAEWLNPPRFAPGGTVYQAINRSYWERPPHGAEIVLRLAIWGPVAIAATLGVLWTIRRLKSRRHTDPPVGFIRDLLWLTLVVAILVAWWLDHCSMKVENPMLNDQTNNAGPPLVDRPMNR